MTWLTSLAARGLVYGILLSVAGVSHVMNSLRRVVGLPLRSRRANRRSMILLGTFYNLGWFRSHVLPLSRTNALDEIIVICDKPLIDAPKVVYCQPPGWLRFLGRTPARFVWSLVLGRRHRTGIWMGYHIMPNALFALVGARLVGGEAIYQMTGGPIQVQGGGFGSENILLRHLRRPSSSLQTLMYHVVRQFDRIIVRGESARTFVRENRLNDRCDIITGSVDTDRFSPGTTTPDYDLVYVSRLVPCKGLETFLEMLAALANPCPQVRAAIVGGGPLLADLRRRCVDLGIENHVDFLGQMDDVEQILRRGRIFVLVSPSEGVSIAMIEAMAVGLPAVVTDVGDLRDLVESGRNGTLLATGDPQAGAEAIASILQDDSLRRKMSHEARSVAVNRCGIEAIANRWNDLLNSTPPESRRTASNAGDSCSREGDKAVSSVFEHATERGVQKDAGTVEFSRTR